MQIVWAMSQWAMSPKLSVDDGFKWKINISKFNEYFIKKL